MQRPAARSLRSPFSYRGTLDLEYLPIGQYRTLFFTHPRGTLKKMSVPTGTKFRSLEVLLVLVVRPYIFEIHNRILFQIKALRLTHHNTSRPHHHHASSTYSVVRTGYP